MGLLYPRLVVCCHHGGIHRGVFAFLLSLVELSLRLVLLRDEGVHSHLELVRFFVCRKQEEFIANPLVLADNANLEGIHGLREVSSVLSNEEFSLLRVFFRNGQVNWNLI